MNVVTLSSFYTSSPRYDKELDVTYRYSTQYPVLPFLSWGVDFRILRSQYLLEQLSIIVYHGRVSTRPRY